MAFGAVWEELELQSLLGLSRRIDAFNTLIGRWLSWLIVVAVVISATNAIVRKLFDYSSNSFLELQWVLFSLVFMLCSPWTLLNGEHIRIDIINHSLSLKTRGWIDMIGHVLFLMPFTLILGFWAVPFFLTSYHQNEQSFSAGGLPQWPAKSLVMIMCAMLFIQGVSEIIKRAAMMRGDIPDSNADAINAQQAAELEAERLAANIAGDQK
jgi:TRAP-type mannitol/chloroaromatic compound transport system permease small subunit